MIVGMSAARDRRYDLPMAQWRSSESQDDEAIVAMSVDLYYRKPPPEGVSESQVRATLAMFRAQPVRGRAIVLDNDGRCAGYAFLVSFWSNELGGEICTVDELYIVTELRSQGHGTQLLASLQSGTELWPGRPVALELEVAPGNRRARVLYERLGFREKRNATMRLRW